MQINALLKRLVHLLIVILLPVIAAGTLSVAGPVAAQVTPTELEWLTVDIWPDFDRPEVLVLLTGSLPSAVTPPVEIVIPLPDGATVNAVARIDDTDSMLADLDPQIGTEFVAFSLPNRRFRVEYYAPYEAEGLDRSFTFDWLAPELNVRDLSLAVQQPALAMDMETDPPAEAVTQGNDQLDYHNLPDTEVPAGEPYVVDVAYTMSEERLTISTVENMPAEAETASTDIGESAGLDLDWPVVLGIVGGLLILLALAWQLFWDRLAGSGSPPRKPRPARGQPQRRPAPRSSEGKARFCHNCGERAQPDDRFCRECGTQLKA